MITPIHLTVPCPSQVSQTEPEGARCPRAGSFISDFGSWPVRCRITSLDVRHGSKAGLTVQPVKVRFVPCTSRARIEFASPLG
jgi:hypothetical protein